MQVKEDASRVTYTVSSFTPQERLDRYVFRRAEELTFRKRYDYFRLVCGG
jgi:hypothetical protein